MTFDELSTPVLLTRSASGEFKAFVNVCRHRGGVIDPDELLGAELAADLADWDLGELRWLGGDRYDVACNWKLAMDTFGETYHFLVLHADTLYGAFYGNVQCYDACGRRSLRRGGRSWFREHHPR